MQRVFFYVKNQLMSEKGYSYLYSFEKDIQVYVGVYIQEVERNREIILEEYSKFTDMNKIYIFQEKESILKVIEEIQPKCVVVVGELLSKDEKKFILGKLPEADLIENLPNNVETKRKSVSVDVSHNLKSLIYHKDIFRVIEASNALMIDVLNELVIKERDGIKEFDGFWSSSLCDSLLHGKPDMEILSTYERINNIREMRKMSKKPIFYDIDSGGRTEQFVDSVIELHGAGVSAVIIEDKVGKKVNSLICNSGMQKQDTIENFAYKIRQGKKAVNDHNFWIIARIESLILGETKEEALFRAEKYIRAGADAILIHYNKNNITGLVDFIESYVKNFREVPLAVIPTMYSYVSERDLIELGCKIVIYANQMTRTSIWAMENVAESILRKGRALESSMNCIPVEKLLEIEQKRR